MNEEIIDKATDAIMQRIEYITVSVIQEDRANMIKEADEIIALAEKIKEEARK
jgi:hypothetical protein